jgi:hypothetical protein
MVKKLRKADPIEYENEQALTPGAFIPDDACFSFVGGLDEAETIAMDVAMRHEWSRGWTPIDGNKHVEERYGDGE